MKKPLLPILQRFYFTASKSSRSSLVSAKAPLGLLYNKVD